MFIPFKNNNTLEKMSKKQFRFYNSYISKLLKRRYPEHGLTTNARQQLNSVLCYLSKQIANDVKSFIKVSGKRTISNSDILSIAEIKLSKELYEKVVKNNKIAITKFTDKSSTIKKGESRQSRAGFIFPPSITEKFLREFNNSNFMVTSMAPITLCVVLEVFCDELFDLAVPITVEKKKKRITIRELQLASRQSEALNQILKDNNIYFIGGGVVPFIHPKLLIKKPRKKKSKLKSQNNDNTEPKKHRYKPGTVALRDIKKLQKVYNNLILAKSPFEKMLRERFNKSGSDSKISKTVFLILQYYLESYLIDIIRQGNFAALHAGRVKLLPEDINFVLAIDNRDLPLQIDKYNEADNEADNEAENEEENEDEDEEKEEDEASVEMNTNITKPSLKRLALQAGVKIMSDDCIAVLRNLLIARAHDICKVIFVVNKSSGTKTIMEVDTYTGLNLLNINITRTSHLCSKTCSVG